MEFSSRKVLILNADFRALSICGVYKAFLLVYLGKAEMVSKADDVFMHSVSTAFDVPSVIRLNNYVHIPYKGVMMTRQNIFRRDGYKCVYCGAKDHLTLDHVLPSSRGGTSTWTNLVTACSTCNAKKGNRLPEEAGMPLPYKPYKPSFVMFLREFSNIGDKTWWPFLNIKAQATS